MSDEVIGNVGLALILIGGIGSIISIYFNRKATSKKREFLNKELL